MDIVDQDGEWVVEVRDEDHWLAIVPVLAERLALRNVTSVLNCFAAGAGEVCDGLWRVGAIAYVGDPAVAVGGSITAMSPKIAGGLGSDLALSSSTSLLRSL